MVSANLTDQRAYFLLVTKYTREGVKKPAVPGKDDKPIHGLVSDKNFIVANAVENILAGKWALYVIFINITMGLIWIRLTSNNF